MAIFGKIIDGFPIGIIIGIFSFIVFMLIISPSDKELAAKAQAPITYDWKPTNSPWPTHECSTSQEINGAYAFATTVCKLKE